MKLSTICNKLYRRSTTHFPYMEHYKYDYYRDPVLKDKVSGKGEKEPRAVCVEEMILMLNCLKEKDFDQRPCTKLIDTFKNCVQVAETRRKKQKEYRATGHVDTTLSTDTSDVENKLSASQVTKLLKRFPEPH